jgi:hypothetical protein
MADRVSLFLNKMANEDLILLVGTTAGNQMRIRECCRTPTSVEVEGKGDLPSVERGIDGGWDTKSKMSVQELESHKRECA